MSSETSVIARKLKNFIVIENAREKIEKPEPGFLKNLLLVSLMGSAVFLTQLTLLVVRVVKRLEG